MAKVTAPALVNPADVLEAACCPTCAGPVVASGDLCVCLDCRDSWRVEPVRSRCWFCHGPLTPNRVDGLMACAECDRE